MNKYSMFSNLKKWSISCYFLAITVIAGAYQTGFSIDNTPINVIERELSAEAHNLDPRVIHLAVSAYVNARHQGYGHKPILSIIDYSKPSNRRRLWVFDLAHHKLLFNEYVAHGSKSGSLVANRFSNVNDSFQSSIGLYVTGDIYNGKKGMSLRLNGLDRGFNDHALQRGIVMHGAWYASPSFVQQHGSTGRSHGCPAINPAIVRQVVQTISNGSLMFAYYPDSRWLAHSEFL